MKNIKHIIFGIALLGVLTACEDFLSERPSKGSEEVIESVTQLEAILNDADRMMKEENFTAFYSTDDYQLPMQAFDDKPNRFEIKTISYYVLSVDGVINAPEDLLWKSLYYNIYNANLILETVDEVSGAQTIKDQVKAEAFFLRAYSNWMLVNYYRLPYASKYFNEIGLLKKVSISSEEIPTQMSLKESYDFIESDIQEALKIKQTEVKYTFRASNAAINAFLSRFYLHIGDYEKALNAANDALANKGNNVHLVDYNTLLGNEPDMRYGELFNYNSYQYANWSEFFYVRLAVDDGQKASIMSNELLAMYDVDYDLRYRCLVRQANNFLDIATPAIYRYTMFGTPNYLPTGPTIQEVMLNKAECLVRKSSPDIQGAINILNELRSYRIDPSDPNLNLSAANQEQALALVLNERRRELPFTQRWTDIRRFSVNETASDDITFTRQFYEVANGTVNTQNTMNYTLPLGSRRYAVPINGMEIHLSQKALSQNTY